MSDGIKFLAHKVRVNGPKVDGGMTISFDLGEDEQIKVAAILTMSQENGLEVEVSNGSSK